MKRFIKKLQGRMRYHFLALFLIFIAVFLYSSIGFYLAEKNVQENISLLDAAWWALVTMTTVGYGDLSPQTSAGRFLVGYPTLIIGVALLGYLLSLIANYVFESHLSARKGKKPMKFTKHVLIIRFNSLPNILKMVKELEQDPLTNKCKIVVIDPHLDDFPQELINLGIKFIHGDPAKLTVLERANFREAKSAIILADRSDPEKSDLKNLAVTLTIESEAPQIHTVVECLDAEHVQFFKKAGCDSVVCMSSLSGQIMTQEIQDPGISLVLKELTSNTLGKQFYLIPLNAHIKTYGEIFDHFNPQKSVLAGIMRDEKTHILPDKQMNIKAGDQAIFIAENRPDLTA